MPEEQVEEPMLNTHFEDMLETGTKLEDANALNVLDILDTVLYTYRFTALNPMGWRLKDFEVAQVMLPKWATPFSKDVKIPESKDLQVLMLRKNSKNIMCGVELFMKAPAVILVDLQNALK